MKRYAWFVVKISLFSEKSIVSLVNVNNKIDVYWDDKVFTHIYVEYARIKY